MGLAPSLAGLLESAVTACWAPSGRSSRPAPSAGAAPSGAVLSDLRVLGALAGSSGPRPLIVGSPSIERSESPSPRVGKSATSYTTARARKPSIDNDWRAAFTRPAAVAAATRASLAASKPLADLTLRGRVGPAMAVRSIAPPSVLESITGIVIRSTGEESHFTVGPLVVSANCSLDEPSKPSESPPPYP